MAANKKTISIEFSTSFKPQDLAKLAKDLKKAIDISDANKQMKDSAEKYVGSIIEASAAIEKLKQKGKLDSTDVKNLEKYTKQLSDGVSDLESSFEKVGTAPVEAMKNLKANLDEIDRKMAESAKKFKNNFKTDIIKKGGKDLKGISYDTALQKAAEFRAEATAIRNQAQEALDLALKGSDPAEVAKAQEHFQKQENAAEKLDNKVKILTNTHREYVKTLNRSKGNFEGQKRRLEEEAQETQKLADAQRKLENSKLTDSLTKQKSSFQDFRETVNLTSNSLSQVTASQEAFGDTFSALGSKIKQVTSVLFLMREAIQILKKSFTTVGELDKQMTEIGIVSKQTNKELWATFGTFNQLAKDLSSTTLQYLEGAKIFYQQGYEMAEVIDLVNATTKAATLSSVSFREASETLTAAIRAFNLEASQAASITDKFAAVGAFSAADFHELSVAMEKVASSAYSAGMSFDYTLGILAKGIETTKEAPEAIGTALKTIIARFQEMKENPMTMLEDGVDANRVEKALKTVNVALRDTNGEFRNLDDVFSDLGAVWGDLSRNQKAYIATMAAGMRQQSRFMAIMNNYDRTLELVRMSTNSAGEANKQYAIYVDSVEAAQNRLKNSQEAFYASITSSDVIKELYSGLSILLDILTSLNPAVLALTVAIGLLGAMIIKFIVIKQAMTGAMKAGSIAMKLSQSETLKHIAVTLGFANAQLFQAGTAELAAQANATLAASIALVIAALAILVISVVLIVRQYQKMKNAVHDLAAEKSKLAQEERDEAKNLESKIERYQELDKKLERTNEEQAEYVTLLREISELAPQLVAGIDAEGNAILARNEILRESINQYKKQAIEAEKAAAYARLASMEQAKWNAEVGKGAPGPKTEQSGKALEAQLDNIMSSQGLNMLGLGLGSWLVKKNIKSGIDAGLNAEELKSLSDIIFNLNKGLVADLAINPGTFGIANLLVSTGLVMSPQKEKKLKKELDEYFEAVERSYEIRASETRVAVANEMASIGQTTLELAELEGEQISDGYKTVVAQLAISASDLAGAGYEDDPQKQTEMILKNSEKIYEKSLEEFEALRSKGGFQKKLDAIFDAEASGESIKTIKNQLNDLFKDFGVSSETQRAIADSLFNQKTFDEAINKLSKSLSNPDNSQKLKEGFEKLSKESYSYFLEMFSGMEDGADKTRLLDSFANALANDDSVALVNDSLKDLDVNSASSMSAFKKTLVQVFEESGESAKDLNLILSKVIDTSGYNLVEFSKELSKTYEAFNNLDETARKASSGILTLAEAFKYLESSEEAVNDLRFSAGDIFVSYSAIVRDMQTQLMAMLNQVDNSLASVQGRIDNANAAIADHKAVLARTDEEYYADILKDQGLLKTSGFMGMFQRDKDIDSIDRNSALEILDKDIEKIDRQLDKINNEDYPELEKKIDELNSKPLLNKTTDFIGLTDHQADIDEERKQLNDRKLALETEKNIRENAKNDVLKGQGELHKASEEAIADKQKEIQYNVHLKNSYQLLRDNIEKTAKIKMDTIVSFQTFLDGTSAINTTITSLKDYGKTLEKVQEGNLSFLDTMNMIGNNPDLLMAMDVVNGSIKITEEGLHRLAQAKKDEVQNFLDGEVAKLQAQYDIVAAYVDGEDSKQKISSETAELAATGTDLVAEAQEGSTKTTLENISREVEARKILLKYIAKAAELLGKDPGQIDFGGVNTEVAKAKTFADNVYAELQKKYQTEDPQLLKDRLAGELEAAKAAAEAWRNVSAEEMLAHAGGIKKDTSSSTNSGKEDNFEAKMQELDKYINYLERLQDLETALSAIDQKIDLSATGGAEDLNLLKEKAQLLADQVEITKQMINVRKDDLALQRQEMKDNYAGWVSFNGSEMVDVRWDLINSFTPANEAQQLWIDGLVESIEKYDEASDSIKEYKEEIIATQKAIEEMREELIDEAINTRQQLYDALVESDRRELDATKEKYDAMKKAQNDYLQAVKTAIDKERQMRSDAQKEDDLNEKRRKLAVLERDTSGLYTREAEALRGEIRGDEESLRDQSVDRQYEALQKQYELQQEQRDLEIQSLEEQIAFREETGAYWNMVDETIRNGPNAMQALLETSASYTNADPLQQTVMSQNFANQAAKLDALFKAGQEVSVDQSSVVNMIKAGADNVANQVSKIQIPTFDTKSITEAINNLQVKINNSGSQSGSSSGTNTSPSGTNTSSSVLPMKPTAAKTIYENKTVMTKEQVKALQVMLNATLGKSLAIDGSYGPATKAAFTEWYRKNNPSKGFPSMAYSTGGVVDYTGPAWVHGSENKPEAFLNANQTKLFAHLRDLLEDKGYSTSSLSKEDISNVVNIGDIVLNLQNPTNANSREIARLVQKEILNTFQNRLTTSIPKSR